MLSQGLSIKYFYSMKNRVYTVRASSIFVDRSIEIFIDLNLPFLRYYIKIEKAQIFQ